MRQGRSHPRGVARPSRERPGTARKPHPVSSTAGARAARRDRSGAQRRPFMSISGDGELQGTQIG